jgi:putative oxidoreductase
MNNATALDAYRPYMLSITRIMTGLLLLAHGTSKHLGFPIADHLPPAGSLPWIAGWFELVCGLLIAVGLFTRPAAFVAAGLCAFAFFIAHFPKSVFPVLNGGDAAVLYCFIFLYFVFAGAGPWSVDGVIGNRAQESLRTT